MVSKVNLLRIKRRLDTLAKIKSGTGINRLALTNADKEARDIVVSWMIELGLNVKVDQIGNIIGIRKGEENLNPIVTGSHIDTVLDAGKYDGAYGVISGLEVIQILNENEIKTKHPIAVAVFTNEEGVRFTPDMLGSLCFTKEILPKDALKIKSNDGKVLGEELKRIGYNGKMKCGEITPDKFIELHIEQGPILSNEKKSIGIVENVVGIKWIEISIRGQSNHSGTTPMDMRSDSLLVASKIITYIRDLTKLHGSNLIATCGNIKVEPNLINVIPGKVIITIDLRSSDVNIIENAKHNLKEYIDVLTSKEKVIISCNYLVDIRPVTFNREVINCIEDIANELNYSYKKITSGAGHDAQIILKICPTAMIFVPSKDGISHNKSEYTSISELERGANVLLNTILRLST